MTNLGNREVMSRNIQKYMAITGKSRRDVSDQTGIKYSTLSEWINCNKYPRIDNIQRLAECFGVDKSALIEDDDSKAGSPYNPTLRIPVLGTIPAGIPLEAIEDIVDWEEIPAEWSQGGKEYFALEVKGNSMYPEFLPKDRVIVRKTDVCHSGDVCVVRVNGSDATLKRIEIGEDHTLTTIPTNPQYPPRTYSVEEIENLPVSIAGVVVEMRRKV